MVKQAGELQPPLDEGYHVPELECRWMVYLKQSGMFFKSVTSLSYLDVIARWILIRYHF